MHGLCQAVCPVGAIEVDRKRSLKFDEKLCTVEDASRDAPPMHGRRGRIYPVH